MGRDPNTKIQFFNVPWDEGYVNVRYFPSSSARDAWFDNRSHITYPDYTEGSASEVRHAQPVKDGVPYTIRNNWDTMYRYNYMRFKNNAYDNSEWVYGFITGWTYSSEHSSTFSWERDIWTNNIGHIVFSTGFIERETTNDVNDLPEPVGVNRHVNHGFHEFARGGASYYSGVVFQGDIDHPEGDAIPSSNIDGVEYPITIAIYNNYGNLASDLKSVSEAGKASNIANTFVIPRAYVAQDVEYRSTNFTGNIIRFSYSRKEAYEPKNAKAKRYPYCYAVYGDYFGNNQMVKWEDIGGDTIPFICWTMANPTGIITCDIETSTSFLRGTQSISHSITTSLGYAINMYSAWLAQNQANIQSLCRAAYISNTLSEGSTGLQIEQNMRSNDISTAQGLLGMLGGVASGGVGDVLGGVQDILFSKANMGLNNEMAERALRNQQAGVRANLRNTLNTNIANAHYLPNNGGVPSGGITSLMSQDKLGFFVYSVSPCATEYQAIDRYFERYGYCVNRFGRPTFDFIRNHYYIKTNGLAIRGTIPQHDRLSLMQVLDRGVTFWNSDTFDYEF